MVAVVALVAVVPAAQHRVHSTIITWILKTYSCARRHDEKSSYNAYTVWFGLFYWAVSTDTTKTKGVPRQVENSIDTKGAWQSFHK